MLPGADLALRQDAMRRAMDLVPNLPPRPHRALQREVYGSDSLAPAALEVIALTAMSAQDRRGDLVRRAE
jgi:hypothetical protein